MNRNLKTNLKSMLWAFLSVFTLLTLTSLSVACVLESTGEGQVDVHIQSDRCRPNLDTAPTHNYVAVTDGVFELAKQIQSVQAPGGGLVLDVCTWQFETNDLAYTVQSVVEDDSIIYIVANSYYEPDAQEFCDLIHDEVSDILWQAKHINQPIPPCQL